MNWQEELYKRLEKGEHKIRPINTFSCWYAGYCQRQIYLSKLNLKKTPHYVLGAMAVGTAIHHFIEDLFSEIQKEVPFTFKDKKRDIIVNGYLDGLTKGEVIEYKSTSSLKYVTEEPKEEHIAQATLYMKGKKRKKATIIYFRKTDFKMISHSIEFDKGLYDSIIDKYADVKEAIKIVPSPRTEEEVPFMKCGCYLCKNERLDFPIRL